MIERRPFETLGGANHGWLDAKHHFSFAEYDDPERVHWGAIRVWNDDTIRLAPAFRRTPTPTWRSSLTSAKVRSPTRTAWATRGAPKPATSRS